MKTSCAKDKDRRSIWLGLDLHSFPSLAIQWFISLLISISAVSSLRRVCWTLRAFPQAFVHSVLTCSLKDVINIPKCSFYVPIQVKFKTTCEYCVVTFIIFYSVELGGDVLQSFTVPILSVFWSKWTLQGSLLITCKSIRTPPFLSLSLAHSNTWWVRGRSSAGILIVAAIRQIHRN